jgi:hypothetical protein
MPPMDNAKLAAQVLTDIRIRQHQGDITNAARAVLGLPEDRLADWFAIYLPASAEGSTETERVAAVCDLADAGLHATQEGEPRA